MRITGVCGRDTDLGLRTPGTPLASTGLGFHQCPLFLTEYLLCWPGEMAGDKNAARPGAQELTLQ